MMNRYNVAPRYSAGSPALVDGPTAGNVAITELQNYTYALSGLWGEDWCRRAQRDGLKTIVEWHTVLHDRIKFVDLLTGDEGVIRDGKRSITGYRGDLIIRLSDRRFL